MPVKKVEHKNEFHLVRVQEFFREAAVPRDYSFTGGMQGGPTSYFVPTLVELCASVIARNFTALIDADKLRDDYPRLYERIIEFLPTDLPLNTSAARVSDDAYWRRCCEARWSFGQLGERTSGKLTPPSPAGWKQFYLEKMLCDYLLSLRSTEMVPEEMHQLDRLCLLSRDYVYAIDLPCQFTRFSICDRLLSKLPHVERLRLTYGACNTGVDFHWGMVGFTENDALDMRYALRKHAPLRELRLPNNRLNSSLLKGIISSLVNNTTMRVLDFSSNCIDDDGVQQLALLLCRPDFPLEELYLQDNQIRGDGAASLGEALSMNRVLRVLSLRLNRIPDEPGGAALVAGLAAHPSIEVIDLSHNALGPATARVFADVLPNHSSLVSLNIAGNRAMGGDDGAAELKKAVCGCRTLRFLDARSCGLSDEDVGVMEGVVQGSVEAAKARIVEAQEAEQRTKILKQVEEKLAKTLCR